MTRFLEGVLSVIALGVLLIAYGLLTPRAAASEPDDPAWGSRAVLYTADGVPAGYILSDAAAPALRPAPAPAVIPARYVTALPVATAPPARERTTATTYGGVRPPARDWKKTALVVGGSTAAAAGVGGIFGGKKGALIGAAIGGGASTLYEAAKP